MNSGYRFSLALIAVVFLWAGVPSAVWPVLEGRGK